MIDPDVHRQKLILDAKIQQCYSTNEDEVCSEAQDLCNNGILAAALGPYDPYYILSTDPDPYPPDLTPYLTDTSLMKQIGAESTWVMSSDEVYFNFADSGDWMRNSRPLLESVINAGVRTVIYDGDVVSVPMDVCCGRRLSGSVQDYILNYFGVEAMVC